MKKNEMDGTYSTYGGENIQIKDLGGETWGMETTWKTQVEMEGGDNIKMDLQEVWWEGTDWTDLAQDRGKCQALVNAVINLQSP